MSRNMRIYYYTILGAIGGLVAWRLTDFIRINQTSIYVQDAALGAVTGLSIGLLIGLAEIFLSKSLLRGLRAGLISGLIGLVAGVVALPLSEFVFLGIVSNLTSLGPSGEIAARALG